VLYKGAIRTGAHEAAAWAAQNKCKLGSVDTFYFLRFKYFKDALFELVIMPNIGLKFLKYHRREI